MYIDPRITENSPPIPTFGYLEPGQAFIYDGELHIKVDDWSAVRLFDGKFYSDSDISSDAGVLLAKVKIVPDDD